MDDDSLELDLDENQHDIDPDGERGPGASASQQEGIDPDDGQDLASHPDLQRGNTTPPPGEAKRDDEGRHRAYRTGSTFLHHAITALCVAGVLVLGVYGYLAVSSPDTSSTTSSRRVERSSAELLRRHAAASSRQRVHEALGVFHLMEQSYPIELEILVDRGLLPPPGVSYPWGGGAVDYQRQGSTFALGQPPFQP